MKRRDLNKLNMFEQKNIQIDESSGGGCQAD